MLQKIFSLEWKIAKSKMAAFSACVPKILFLFFTHHQTQSTPRLFFCSLCLRVCSLSGSHNQMRLTVPNARINCCCSPCVRATYSRTKKQLVDWVCTSQLPLQTVILELLGVGNGIIAWSMTKEKKSKIFVFQPILDVLVLKLFCYGVHHLFGDQNW
jgi:hypothetical protein